MFGGVWGLKQINVSVLLKHMFRQCYYYSFHLIFEAVSFLIFLLCSGVINNRMKTYPVYDSLT